MSNPGEWIDFAALCERVKDHGLNKSPRTLRRYCADGLISFRQPRRGAPMAFNWKTVEKELRSMDSVSAAAERLAALPAGDFPPDIATQLAGIRSELAQLRTLFAGAQPRVGA